MNTVGKPRKTLALLAVLCLAAAGCSGGGGSTSLTPETEQSNPGVAPAPNSGRVALADWQPLPAASDLSVPQEVQTARDTILGQDATNPEFVRLWWFGVSSFVVSLGGHLFLFDAWEPVGLQENYVNIGREELAAIAPEAILIGHGHFDHAADAGYIAGRTGAAVVGSEEICGVAKDDAAEEGNADNFPCLITGTMNRPAPGVIQPVKLWADLPEVHILQHLHSAASPQDPGTPFIHIPALLPFIENLNLDPAEYQKFFASLGDPQGGTWAYHLRMGDFSLLWHDSAGPVTDNIEFGPEVQAALDSFPDCVDVHIGAIVGFDQPISGLRDPRLYVEHSHPKVTLPNHHDAWAPVAGGGAEAYEDEWRREIASLEHPPVLDYLRDPIDYMAVRSYRVDAAEWKPPMAGSSCAP